LVGDWLAGSAAPTVAETSSRCSGAGAITWLESIDSATTCWLSARIPEIMNRSPTSAVRARIATLSNLKNA
jgi:hypothetical protein